MVENRQAEALAVTCIFPIFAALFVGARTLSRYLGQNHGWDDWLIYLALLLLLGQTITIYEYILLSHTGYHSRDVPKPSIDQQVLALKWSFAVQMFYHPLMGSIRASIIMFLFRVKDQRWPIRMALHVVFWMNIGYTVSTSLVNIFQCTPIRYAYLRPLMDQEVGSDGTVIKHGKCIKSLDFIMASCGLSIFMDLIIIPIPTAMVWNLQMRKKTKLAVVAVMSMGWIATIASVVRLIVYYIRYAPQTDRMWNIGVVTSIVEPSVGIIAACAPALRRLFTYMLPRYFSDNRTSYPTRTQTEPKSRQRQSFNFQFSVGKEVEEGRMDTVRDEQAYGMRPLGSVDSRERIGSMAGDACNRTRSVKTGISEGPSEAFEPEPEHILSNQKH
ncbi:hypothetical protein K458DRAFT_358151 [Lentithecium fluviatile CBS 122367]|uniref:Rhodopsin domain-containing protein n=1 Tax=Lentithecium fluviatile CBS 122367 TaxID=1168545 RepID=A0A6G1JH03_9PLEO|nr:hypothetical protein K458DRAFT_358151 [Lentithecium fluviatile CBS 122367]